MTYNTIDVKLRPLKLAFLVNPRDRAAILQAIEINTFLWGGMFNPIIPAFERTTKALQEHPFKSPPIKKIIEGYLDAYDPDYVVPLGKCSDRTFEIGNRKSIVASDIMSSVEKDGIPNYGVGIFEILQYFINKELKFIRRKPLNIQLLNFGKPTQLFLASIFGSLPQNIDQILKENFKESLGAKEANCTISNYSDFLKTNIFFLIRISSHYLNRLNAGGRRHGTCIFFLDASKTLDVIDYWNLRAMGWNILPIPKQSANLCKVKKLAIDFIEQNFSPHFYNPDFYYNTTILKSRTTTEEELKHFVSSLKIPPSNKPSNSKIIYHFFYPRIWDEWARDKDGVGGCDLEASTIQHDLPASQKTITFRTLDPKFISRFGGHGTPRFANEIKLRLYNNDEIFAEVIPECDEKLTEAIDAIRTGNWRFAKKGLTYLSNHTNWAVRLSLPKSDEVFSRWLESKKWSVEHSTPGSIAKQMILQLGGKWGISILADEGIIRLLEKVSTNKTIKVKALRSEISKIANQDKFKKDPNRILQRLIDLQIFRLGIEIQCPVCGQYSWYSLKDLDYELRCSKCLKQFLIPSHSPHDIKWSYSAFGPFNLPKRAYGVYSVLLTLLFFSLSLHSATTPMLSFKATKNGQEIEVDLGLLVQMMLHGKVETELIFAECKTYNHFIRKDTERMKFLAEQFPGAILVFSTFRKSLSTKEKKLIRSVANRGRRYWKANRPFNPVLILTGIELFSLRGPTGCWEDIGGKHTAFVERHRSWRNLLELCDATQQLYLDMEPWQQWLDKRWGERKLKAKS